MITIDRINAIYDKYITLPADADLVTERNLHDLMMYALDSEFIGFDGDRITFAKGEGPLASVEIDRIQGAEDLGSHYAIILPTSVVFINKSNGKVNVFLADQPE